MILQKIKSKTNFINEGKGKGAKLMAQTWRQVQWSGQLKVFIESVTKTVTMERQRTWGATKTIGRVSSPLITSKGPHILSIHV